MYAGNYRKNMKENISSNLTHPFSANWQWKEAVVYPATTDVRL